MPRILGSIGNHPFGTGDGFEGRPVCTWSAFYYPPVLARSGPATGRSCSMADIITVVC